MSLVEHKYSSKQHFVSISRETELKVPLTLRMMDIPFDFHGADQAITPFPPKEIYDLPEEVQALILNMLGDVQALKNCCLAWPWWSNLLSSKKPTFLAAEGLPNILPFLAKGDILNCRATCRKWKNTIDYILTYGPFHARDAPETQLASLNYISPEMSIFQDVVTTFHNSDEIDKFIGLVDSCTIPIESPFLWRAVAFNFVPQLSRAVDGPQRTQEEYQEYFDRAFAIMTKYGHYIWRFSFHFPNIHELRWPRITLRAQFLALLRMVRNIRSLKVTEASITETGEDYRQRRTTYPHLRHLKEMHFPGHMVTFTRLIHEMIVLYGPQLNTFDMDASLFHQCVYWSPLRHEQLRLSDICPNLVHIKIRGCTNPVLWHITKCPQWNHLRTFHLMVAESNRHNKLNNQIKIWELLKMMYEMVEKNTGNIDVMKVNLRQPTQLPYIQFKTHTVTVNATFDHDEGSNITERKQLKLLVPTAILLCLTKARHIIISAYKKTPIQEFKDFENLRENVPAMDWFWQNMPQLKTITVQIKLYDVEHELVILNDTIFYERHFRATPKTIEKDEQQLTKLNTSSPINITKEFNANA